MICIFSMCTILCMYLFNYHLDENTRGQLDCQFLAQDFQIKEGGQSSRKTQNYPYWDANFCLSKHKFYNTGVLRTHVFFTGTCQNSVADRQIYTAGDQKPLILPRNSY